MLVGKKSSSLQKKPVVAPKSSERHGVKQAVIIQIIILYQNMVESTAIPHFKLSNLQSTQLPETQAPFLCEIWNWQGDTSVLPYKWVEVLSSVSGSETAYDSKTLKQSYVSSPQFDPNAFFFLTYRSHAIGLCLVWPTPDGQFEIKHLCSVPSHRGKGVEECLLGLALKYCKGKGAKEVTIKFDESPLREYQEGILRELITSNFGFVASQ
ncbi:hypothetical protein FGO68_gene5615 [Halteria grandinella]|uniref:N-acetyltransferase domain-containing protein n=1 Tax=Halteria grandinella TaxID=5974 RepID=A0A8J8NPP8_HALGN|nr:hypothetical protein FGO68_gene5615 [Halteria grandinella]